MVDRQTNNGIATKINFKIINKITLILYTFIYEIVMICLHRNTNFLHRLKFRNDS